MNDKCQCGKVLEFCPEVLPWNPDCLICPECDSTYVIEETKILPTDDKKFIDDSQLFKELNETFSEDLLQTYEEQILRFMKMRYEKFSTQKNLDEWSNFATYLLERWCKVDKSLSAPETCPEGDDYFKNK